MIKKTVFFILLLVSLYPYAIGKVIIWDLGKVLLDVNKIGMGREIGFWEFAKYSLAHLRSPFIEPLIFSLFESMETPQEKLIERAISIDGKPMPALLCKWQAGLLSGQEIVTLVDNHIEHLFKLGYFLSAREKKLVRKTVHAMLNPRLLADNTYVIKKAAKIIRQCAAAKHTLFVLSNWDPVSFEDIYKNCYQQLFKYFDKRNIIISGKLGIYKPQQDIYNYVLKNYKLKPADCIFIDDQKANTDAAQACGITSITFDGNYTCLRNKLTELGILPKS